MNVIMEKLPEDVQALLNLTDIVVGIDESSVIYPMWKYYYDRDGHHKVVYGSVHQGAPYEDWHRAISIMLARVERDCASRD